MISTPDAVALIGIGGFGFSLFVVAWAMVDIYIYPRIMVWVERNAVATEIGFRYANRHQALVAARSGDDAFATTPYARANKLNIDPALAEIYARLEDIGVASVISAETLHMVLKKIGRWDANNALDYSGMHTLNYRFSQFDNTGLMLPRQIA